MMHKRTLISLLIVSFIVAFAASMSVANTVTVQTREGLARCTDYSADITADVTVDAVSAIEIVLEVDKGTLNNKLENVNLVWDLPNGVLSERTVLVVPGVDSDIIRATAMRVDAQDGTLSGNSVVAHLDFSTPDACDGEATVENTVFDYENETGDVTTQFVDAETQRILAVQVVGASIGQTNSVPEIAGIGDEAHVWNTNINIQAEASDADVEDCESLKFYKVGPDPAGLSVSLGGLISWQTTGADICDHEVRVRVVDKCGAADTTDYFTITVTNAAPQFTNCPTEAATVDAGDTFELTLTADDADNGPYKFFNVISGPGAVDGNGNFSWETAIEDVSSEAYEICVSVTDSANLCEANPDNADTCCFDVLVRGIFVSIDKLHGTEGNNFQGVIQGQIHTVGINYAWGPEGPTVASNYPIAGFDLLISYDASALSFVNATRGSMISGNCEWEYFQYRQGGECSSCQGACPSGELRFVGMAEQNDAVGGAGCYDPATAGGTGLVDIDFLVTDNRTFECQYVPVRFYWCDCGDNTLSSVGGDLLLMSKRVWDYGSQSYVEDYDGEFPTYTGAPWPACVEEAKYSPWQAVNFFNGGVDIICSEDIDAPGDINANAIANEIADAVMFTNYFIAGLSAFGDHQDASIAASDVNKDGIVLSVADLVYLIRVVVGDAQPYPKETSVAGRYTHDDGIVSVRGLNIGAAYIVVAGNVTPELLVSGMEVKSRFDGTNTRIIVTPELIEGPMASFTGDFVSGINGEIVSIEMATSEGILVDAKNVPTNYELSQNYPNPFNPTTTISLALPQAGAYELTFYNIQGQVVEVHSGVADGPGNFEYEWDASNLASGVYLYRLTAGNFSEVKKAVLLK